MSWEHLCEDKLTIISWLLVTFPITSFVVFTALSFVSIWSVAMVVWCGTRQPKQLEESSLDRLEDAVDHEEDEEATQRSIDVDREETPSDSVTLDGESVASSQWRAYDSSEPEEAVETPTASTPERSLTPQNGDENTQLRHRTGRDYQASDDDNDHTSD